MKLSALYTLQDRLARDAKQMCGFEHRHVTFGYVLHELRTQIISEPDAPWCAERDLFTSDKAIIEPAMQGRGCNPQRFRGLLDGHAVSVRCVFDGLEARNLPVRAQAGHAIGGEREICRGGTPLSIEDA